MRKTPGFSNPLRLVGACMVVAAGLVLPACESPLSRQPVSTAQPVAGWSDSSTFVTRDGVIFFSGQPTRGDLQKFAKMGGRTVINLRTDAEMKQLDFIEPSYVNRLSMEYISIPVTPESFSTDDVARLSEALDSHAGMTLIHSSSGNRVGGLWAVYLARERGYEWDEALAYGRAAGLQRDSMVEAATRVAQAP